MDQDELVNKRVVRIARDHGSSVAEVNAALDRHPIELDRDKYLRRTLAMELHKLDELEEAFHSKAILNRDVAAGALLVKIYERRALLSAC
jgi:DNA-binding transcriptional MerR regulator